MTKNDLKEKIRKLLDVTASESDVAFELMIKKISALIKPDEALKIPDVGVFMLKKEPLPREERANVGAASKNSLIFSPVSDDFSSETDSVFLSFDLDEAGKDNFEFNDNIFSVSVGKPIVTPTGVKNFDSPENDGAMKTTLEEKVTQLVTNSERTADFNLWDNYLSSVGDEDVEDDLKELISQNVGERTSEEEESENQQEENNAEKEPDEETADEKTEDSSQKEEEEIKWDWGEELKEELGAEDEPEKTTEEETSSTEEETAEIENETSELFEPMEDEREETEAEENQTEETPDEEETEPEKEEETTEEEEEDELGDDFDNARQTVEYSPGDLPPEPEEKKKKGFAIPKFGKMFWILLGAFLIIGIAGAYFLFFTGEEKPKEETAVEHREEVPSEEYRKRLKPEEHKILSDETHSETHDYAEEEHSAKNINDEQTDETIREEITEPETKQEEKKTEEKPAEHKTEETKHDTKHETPPASHEKKVEEKKKQKEEKTVQQKNSLYKKFPGEKQISNLIFKHGGNYSVQISSWRDRNKAESEAKRLRNMGYDAFIVEKYLSALRSNWYLVRIGFFNSPEEAKQFRTKNKF